MKCRCGEKMVAFHYVYKCFKCKNEEWRGL